MEGQGVVGVNPSGWSRLFYSHGPAVVLLVCLNLPLVVIAMPTLAAPWPTPVVYWIVTAIALGGLVLCAVYMNIAAAQGRIAHVLCGLLGVICGAVQLYWIYQLVIRPVY